MKVIALILQSICSLVANTHRLSIDRQAAIRSEDGPYPHSSYYRLEAVSNCPSLETDDQLGSISYERSREGQTAHARLPLASMYRMLSSRIGEHTTDTKLDTWQVLQAGRLRHWRDGHISIRAWLLEAPQWRQYVQPNNIRVNWVRHWCGSGSIQSHSREQPL